MHDRNLGWLIAVGICAAALLIGAAADLPAGDQPGPSLHVLILDNSLERPIYRPERQWGRFLGDVPYDRVHMPSSTETVALEEYTHVIISGSAASVVEPAEWVDAEAALVRDAVEMDLAVLGSCFGHQMLVYALSGPEYVRHAERSEIGWIEIRMDESEATADPVFADIPAAWHAFAWHRDEVVDPPAPWRVLGSSTGCAVHVIRFGEENVWGLQSHPETSAHIAKTLLWLQRIFLDWHSEEIKDALGQPPQDDGTIVGIVERFLAVGRQP